MTIFPGGPQDGVQYTLTSPAGNIATFNNPADANYVGYAWFSGLDSPDIRESIADRAGTDGALQGLNFRGSRAVVINVEIVATSTTDRNNKFQKLKRAANCLRNDGTLDFTPDAGIASRVYVRLNGPIRRADERGWKYTVQIPLMSADPYIYSQTQRSSVNAGAGGTTATLTNQGDGQAAPTINVTMTSTSTLNVSNLTTGQSVSTNSTIDPTTLIPFLNKFGSSGTGNGQFGGISDVAVDASGNIYVATVGDGRIQKFNSSFVYQSTNTMPGGTYAVYLCTDASSNLYVAYNGSANSLKKYNSAGTLQWTFSGSAFGATNGPQGLDIDGTNVHVCDPDNSVIKKYSMTTGVFAASYGAAGSGNGQFNFPADVTIDGSGNRYVADKGNNRIQKFNSSDVYSAQVGSYGTGNGQFQNLYNLVADGSANIYGVDYSRNDVQKFNSSLVYQTKFGTYGYGDGQFSAPGGIDRAGNVLYIADQGNYRVETFDISGSGVVTFNFAAAALSATGFNLYSKINVPLSTWWALQPGDNSVQVSGSGVTTWTALWRDAWL